MGIVELVASLAIVSSPLTMLITGVTFVTVFVAQEGINTIMKKIK